MSIFFDLVRERAPLLRIKAEASARLMAEQAAQVRAARRENLLGRAATLSAAEQAAGAEAASEQAAFAAEVERLRARTSLEILQDEMAELKHQMASSSAVPLPQLRMDGELDKRFNSSCQEMAAMREELAALHAQNEELCAALAPALAEIKQLKEYVLWHQKHDAARYVRNNTKGCGGGSAHDRARFASQRQEALKVLAATAITHVPRDEGGVRARALQSLVQVEVEIADADLCEAATIALRR